MSQLPFLEGFRRAADQAREMFDYSETLFRAAISAQDPIDAQRLKLMADVCAREGARLDAQIPDPRKPPAP